MATLTSRITGALLGHAAGSALGAASDETCLWRPGGRALGSRPDPTWAVLDLYLNGYTPEAAANRLVGGANPAVIYFTGALEVTSGLLPASADPNVVTFRPWSESLLRALPTGLVRAETAQRAAEARDLSAITHGDWRSVDACVAYCHLASSLLDGADPLDAVTDVIEDSSIRVEVRQRVAGASVADFDPEDLDTSGCVLSTLEIAAWAVCAPGSLEDVLTRVVELGRDARTEGRSSGAKDFGAIAGGLLGVRHGAEAIPPAWVDGLEYRPLILDVAPSMVRLRTSQDHLGVTQ